MIGAGCSDPDKQTGTTSGVAAPTVLSESPTAGAAATCPNTIVTATFSEAINPVTIDGSTFTVTAAGGAVAGQVTYDAADDTAIFTPANSLAVSTVYTATITTGAHDMYGNALAANFVWTFTTGAVACVAPAPPVSVSPPNGSSGICPNTVVAATFPQAMDPTTITTATFTVSPGVTGTVTHDVTNKIFTFTPSASLGLSKLYTATITTGAKDPSGNALAANYVWTFTTAAAACAAAPPPTVISVTPPNGAVGVCPNIVVTATFSEAMNPATINTTTFTVAGVTGTVISRRHRENCSVHPVRQSGTQHNLYRHHHDRGAGCVGQCAGRELCVELHHGHAGMSDGGAVGIGCEFCNSGGLHRHQYRPDHHYRRRCGTKPGKRSHRVSSWNIGFPGGDARHRSHGGAGPTGLDHRL